jgi:two-component system NarL family response regulator
VIDRPSGDRLVEVTSGKVEAQQERAGRTVSDEQTLAGGDQARTAARDLHGGSRRARAVMRIRVLVADDFPLVREGISRALVHDSAIEVVGQASGGREALELAERLEPDVLILDLRMPDLGGLAVLDKLRTTQPEIRVLVMTASEKANALLDAIAAGAAGYLSKRITGEQLRHAVIAAYGGGSVITPSLASHLLEEYSSAMRDQRSQARPLRGRELEIMRLVVRGKTDAEIGRELLISARTVQSHLRQIREKTGLRRRAELTRWAVKHALA